MRLAVCFLLLFQALQLPLATAQDYPTKPVRMIVPFAPGGVADIIARLLAQRLTESLGQTVVVDNRPGAGGVIGTELLAKSAPDGYSLILQDMAYTISPAVYGKVPYDPVKDFTAITLVARTPQWLFVFPGIPAKSVNELVALAKTQSGKYTIGSSGNGTGTHLMAELLMRRAGIKLTHVPYKGAGPSVNAAVGGEITSVFAFMPVALSFVQAGRLRAIGVTMEKRHPAYPDVPTFEESGIPNMVVNHWLGVMTPAGLPKPISSKLHRELSAAVNHPTVFERFKALTLEPITTSPSEFRAVIESDLRRWGTVVKEANIQLQ